MNILIVGKTKQREGACIGGIICENSKSVRLLPIGGGHAHPPEKYAIGDIWSFDLRNPGYELKAPHLEDMYIQTESKIGSQPDLKNHLLTIINPTQGTLNNLFDGALQFTSYGRGFISMEANIPNHSTEFWLTSQDLNYQYDNQYKKHIYHIPQFGQSWSIPYVGYQTPIQTIPKGVLVRLSLARWWDQNGKTEQRCSLQLSDWYLN